MKVTLKPNKAETVILATLFAIIILFLITDVIMLECGKAPIFCKPLKIYFF